VNVETVTTVDLGFLHAVRDTLREAEEVYVCVAFAHERGVRLLADELDALRKRRARVRMLVTTAFDRAGATGAALAVASGYGVEVRVHNHAGGTYHPKLYLGIGRTEARAVIGSANLTAGIACNVELGVSLRGSLQDPPLASALRWAGQVWSDARSERWISAAEEEGETITPELFAALVREYEADPVFKTITHGKPDHVVDVRRSGVLVATERTLRRRTGPQNLDAWMLNLAWDWLRSRGELANRVLEEELRVHRSSAVCAVLARVPGVVVASRSPIVLRWVGQG